MDKQYKLPPACGVILHRYIPSVVASLPLRLPEAIALPVPVQCLQHSDRISAVLSGTRFGRGH